MLREFLHASRHHRDGRQQFRRLHRLGDVRDVSRPKRSRAILGARESRQRYRRDPSPGTAVQLPHIPQKLISVNARHADVAYQHVRSLLLEQLQRLRRRLGGAEPLRRVL